jgi:hypothetical protein
MSAGNPVKPSCQQRAIYGALAVMAARNTTGARTRTRVRTDASAPVRSTRPESRAPLIPDAAVSDARLARWTSPARARPPRFVGVAYLQRYPAAGWIGTKLLFSDTGKDTIFVELNNRPERHPPLPDRQRRCQR